MSCGGFTALLILLVTVAEGCSGCGCSDDIRLKKASPSGKLRAAAVVRECDATVSSHTFLVIGGAGEPITGNQEHAALVVRGRREIPFFWKSDKELVVRMPEGRVVEQRLEFKGIIVSYE